MSGFDLFFQWFAAIAVLCWLGIRGYISLLHPIFIYWIFHLIVFVIRPSTIFFFEFDLVWQYIGFRPDPKHIELAFMVSTLGLICFTIGYSLVARSERATLLPRPPDKAETNGFIALTVLLLPFVLASIIFARPEPEIAGGIAIMKGTSGYLNDSQFILIPLLLGFIVITGFRWYAFVPLAVYFAYRAFIGWGRYTIILTFLMVIMASAWRTGTGRPRWWLWVPIPLLAFMFLQMSHDRYQFAEWMLGEPQYDLIQVIEEKTAKEQWDTLDFASFDYLTFIISVVPEETQTYNFFYHYSILLTEWIPRKLWAGKPVGPPFNRISLHAYGNFVGLTMSLVGDGWFSLGWLGVIVLLTGTGALCGVLRNIFVRNHNNVIVGVGFIVINALLIQHYRDGGVQIVRFMIFSFSPVVLWWWLTNYVYRTADERERLRQAQETQESEGPSGPEVPGN